MNIASYNKWCKAIEADHFWDSAEDAAYAAWHAAWKAATLAERERLKEVISVDYKFFNENYSELPGEVGQYYAGRLDSYDEVLHVIDNPDK